MKYPFPCCPVSSFCLFSFLLLGAVGTLRKSLVPEVNIAFLPQGQGIRALFTLSHSAQVLSK